MPLAAGFHLGPYEILLPLGAGGMGEVYRAKDTKLGREVALKLLPATFTNDPERLARFRREAQVLASLNHPHIGAIYGLDEANGQQFLVLELVDGESLDKRIKRGAIALDEAVGIARQIAEALEAAHEKGIIHRDLKPANVALTSDGQVKVLDFGLAKAVEPSVARDLANSPTLTSPAMMTGVGVILGTAAYMSPEQARGRATDKRSDVWAFGCVLYEMLTGWPPFAGETVSDTIANVLGREPEWGALPGPTPANIRRLLYRCLGKDPKYRLHDVADARLDLDAGQAAEPKTMMPVVSGRARWRREVPWVSAALVTGIFVGSIVVGRLNLLPLGPALPAPIMRFVIAPDEPLAGTGASVQTAAVALSSDGRYVSYVAGARRQLYLRALDGFESKLISGTEGADNPFFSPDGQWLGFFTDHQLRKVSLAGGPPITVCDNNSGAYGASWTADGTILFAPVQSPVSGAGVVRVSADGGTPTAVTVVEEKDRGHRWPEALPDGKAVLFSVTPAGGSWSADAMIYVQSLETGKRRALVKGIAGHYLPTGHLVYAQSGILLAVPFDASRLVVTGDPVRVLDHVQQTDESGPQASISRRGTMIYVPAVSEMNRALVAVDRAGVEQALNAPSRPYRMPRFSPDGRRIAVVVEADRDDLWVDDLSRGTLSRLTVEGDNAFPLWTSGGRRLTFSSVNTRGVRNIYWKLADGSGAEERLLKSEHSNVPFAWSPDGRFLAFVDFDPVTHWDIWILSIDERKPRPFLRTKSLETAPAFSSDGRWLAYVSDESGRNEIYVRPFLGSGEKWQVSTDGGDELVWPRSAHELFYRSADAIMAVDVQTTPKFSAGQPRQLFARDYAKSEQAWPNYDVTSDGQRFVMVKAVEGTSRRTQINVVVNWLEELKARVPTK